MSAISFCTLMGDFAKANSLKLLVQLLDLLFHEMCVPLLCLLPESINVTFVDVGKIVLHELEICLHGLCEETFIH